MICTTEKLFIIEMPNHLCNVLPSKDDHEFDLLSDSHCDDSVSGCSEYQSPGDMSVSGCSEYQPPGVMIVCPAVVNINHPE